MSTKLEIKNRAPRSVSSQATGDTSKGKKNGKSKQDSSGLNEANETPIVKPVKAKSKKTVVRVQCHAARSDKKRCTRIATKDSNLCYWHVEHLTYGMFSEEPTGKKPNRRQGADKTETKKATTQVNVGETDSTECPEPIEPPKPKTRGRKRKQAIDPRFNDPAYITMWPEICDGICVLVDRYDNVYTYGTDPVTFLGVKLLTGKIDRNAGPRIGF